VAIIGSEFPFESHEMEFATKGLMLGFIVVE
jgi:hypothetical protein